jgi:hypothetical protein
MFEDIFIDDTRCLVYRRQVSTDSGKGTFESRSYFVDATNYDSMGGLRASLIFLTIPCHDHLT